MIRVMVVEDSPTARRLLVSLLDSDPDIEVVGQATEGRQAVDMATELRPDMITMDVLMPDIDGLETTRRIVARHPTPIIIVTAHSDSKELNVAFEALKAGALDVVAKPPGFGERKADDWEQDLVEKVKVLSGVQPRPVEAKAAQPPRIENTTRNDRDEVQEDKVEKQILIVEDSPTQALRAQLLLQEAGYQASVAENGQKGLEKALTSPPDLVVADIVMPIMDGYEMTRRLKADPHTAKVPVLMLTSQDQPLDVIHGLEAGADHFITKPYEKDDLLRRIRRLFEQLEKSEREPGPETQALEHFGQEIVITKHREQVLESLLRATARVVDCQSMALLSRQPDGRQTQFTLSFRPLQAPAVAQLGAKMQDVLSRMDPASSGSAETKKMQVVVAPEQPPLESQGDPAASFLHAPLIAGGETVGLIGVFSARDEAFDLEHVRFLFDMGQKAAEALSRIKVAGAAPPEETN